MVADFVEAAAVAMQGLRGLTEAFKDVEERGLRKKAATLMEATDPSAAGALKASDIRRGAMATDVEYKQELASRISPLELIGKYQELAFKASQEGDDQLSLQYMDLARVAQESYQQIYEGKAAASAAAGGVSTDKQYNQAALRLQELEKMSQTPERDKEIVDTKKLMMRLKPSVFEKKKGLFGTTPSEATKRLEGGTSEEYLEKEPEFNNY